MTDFTDFLVDLEARGGYVGSCKTYIDTNLSGMTWAEVLSVIGSDPDFDPSWAAWCLLNVRDLLSDEVCEAFVDIIVSGEDVWPAVASRIYVRVVLNDRTSKKLRDSFRGRFGGTERLLRDPPSFARPDLRDLEARLG